MTALAQENDGMSVFIFRYLLTTSQRFTR